MRYHKPNKFYYRVAQTACWVVSKAVFRNKVVRNELKHAKGPFVVIANHQCAYDFANLICATKRPMSFVISNSFYSSLPIRGFLDKMGVIPKQQFQTSVADMKNMKAVIDHGAPLVIYPAGLMCEDGLSTPIPGATFKFLKWLGADVYVARSRGTYFVMPKWSKGMHRGKTSIDIFKLFSKEKLAEASIEEVRSAAKEALLFDAYREQDADPQRYRHGDHIAGLEHVLYRCPHCGEEFTMEATEIHQLRCTACGYAQKADRYGFFHNEGIGPEIRYVSDWSKMIFEDLQRSLQQNPDYSLCLETEIQTLSPEKPKFIPVGEGKITINGSGITLEGALQGEAFHVHLPVGATPTLPFSPGKYLELQHGSNIYRCVLRDGKQVMKCINLVKIFYQLHIKELTEIG